MYLQGKVNDLKYQNTEKLEVFDKICVGCVVNSETGDEILSCTGFTENKNDKIIQSLQYDMLFSGKISEMTEVAKTLIMRLKVRDKILEEPD